MKLHVIVAKHKKHEEASWALTAWDEWSIDENYEGFEEAIEKAKSENPSCEIAVGIVHVPDTFFDKLFQPRSVVGEID